MINLPGPMVGTGAFACAVATLNNAFTSARSKTAADSIRRKRVCLPEPTKICFGSGKLAPWVKHNPTPLEAAAREKMQSEGALGGTVADNKEIVVVVNQLVQRRKFATQHPANRSNQPLVLRLELPNELAKVEFRVCEFSRHGFCLNSESAPRRNARSGARVADKLPERPTAQRCGISLQRVRPSKSCPSPSPWLIHRPICRDSEFPASSALRCFPLARRKRHL